jgi:hypothetical protein
MPDDRRIGKQNVRACCHRNVIKSDRFHAPTRTSRHRIRDNAPASHHRCCGRHKQVDDALAETDDG